MPDENDKPLTEEELARARAGEALIAAAVADVRAPQSLRDAVERDRERAAARARAPFWRRRRWILASAGAAAAVLAVVAVTLQTGGGTTEPSLNNVFAAARLEPTKAAPRPVGGTPPNLVARVDNLVFPDWEKSFGWRPSTTETARERGSATPSCQARPSAPIRRAASSLARARATTWPGPAGARSSPGSSRATPA
jgi:hypothetical protein